MQTLPMVESQTQTWPALGFLLLQRDAMTIATLKKEIFNWSGPLTVSEVQTIIMMRSTAACRQMW